MALDTAGAHVNIMVVLLPVQLVGRPCRTQPETFPLLGFQTATLLIPTVCGGSPSPLGRR